MNRWKSPLLWTALFTQIVLILPVFNIGEDVIVNINVYFKVALEILIIVGILNNPTDKKQL